MTTKYLSGLVGLASILLAGPALANDANEAACEWSALGDACVREDGDAGTCVSDESDPDVLTCEDEPGMDDDGGIPDDADDFACEGLDEGDACIRGDGSDGFCTPDQSDPGVLECEDEPGMDDDGGIPDDADDFACEGLDEGDACVRGDGSDGFCTPDQSDPGVLECEDEPGMDDSNSDSDSNSNSNSNSNSDSDSDSDLDTLACSDLEEDDACIRGDGSDGFCTPDQSDPGVLECEDDAAPSPSGEDQPSIDDVLSCSVTQQAPAPAGLALLMLLGLVRRRRRRLGA